MQELEIQETHKTPRYIRLNHSEDKIIGDERKGVQTRRKFEKEYCLILKIEPKNVDEACIDEHWVKEMEEELDQIEKNKTWELVPRPKDKNVIGDKWVFRNKIDEN